MLVVATMKHAATIIKESVTRFHPWDLVILFISSVFTISTFILVYGSGQGDLQVIIEGPGQSWIYPLSTEETIQVRGPLGDTVVVIHQGSVHVDSSPCQNQLCVAAGEIRQQGQWVACLPNQVFVRIEGAIQKDGLDGSTY